MSAQESVREVLRRFAEPVPLDGMVEIQSQCLYPSGAYVVLFVSGGRTGARVTDEGGALDELTTHNKISSDIVKRVVAPACKRWGVRHEKGKIFATSKDITDLRPAIARVANASSYAAQLGFERIKGHSGRSIKRELHKLLDCMFDEDRVKANVRLHGKSNRSYKFDRLIEFSDTERLIVDPVTPDANSVNSRAVAHLDLRQLENHHIHQRIVYDESESWNASDLSLLQMASTTIPLSHLSNDLRSYLKGLRR